MVNSHLANKPEADAPKQFCVGFTMVSDGKNAGYCVVKYLSRIARIEGWGRDYPGAESELEFWTE